MSVQILSKRCNRVKESQTSGCSKQKLRLQKEQKSGTDVVGMGSGCPIVDETAHPLRPQQPLFCHFILQQLRTVIESLQLLAAQSGRHDFYRRLAQYNLA